MLRVPSLTMNAFIFKALLGTAVLVTSPLFADETLSPLTPEELATPQQQALLQALAGDPYGHRAAAHARAGCLMNVRPLALPSNTASYDGYWIGGGQAIKGYCPAIEDGTFGWDYFGLLFTKRIDLHWSYGRRHQGGTGSYHTDGPHWKHE
jgi:hypothetical protein